MKMKKVCLLILMLLPVFSFSQKISNSDIMPFGDGVYMVSKHGSTGFTSLGKLRKKAYTTANEFARDNNAIAEVISVNETPAGIAVWPQVDLKFRLVKKSIKLANSNSATVTISSGYDANGNRTDGQIVVKNPSQDENSKLEKLEKLGKLFKDGILSKDEFEAEKAKLLSDH